MSDRPYVSFRAFFTIWASLQRWKVPPLHLVICDWLEHCVARVRVLKVFRGAAKSTIFGVFKAYRFYRNPALLSQVWAADDTLALKMTRHTRHVLRMHPLCRGLLPTFAGVKEFWLMSNTDIRNPSMTGRGILSNFTGSRADEIDFDDIEVPKNIKTVESRAAVRARISETTHILTAGGRKTFIGTPHTHNSIYDEEIAGGAEVLNIPLFKHAHRYEHPGTEKRFRIPFELEGDGLTVIAGIGKFARVLREGVDYHVTKNVVVFFQPPGVSLDLCSGNAWPDRFNEAEVEFKRRECKTFNEWDSQYQLHSKPISEVRLDPARIRAYDLEPVIRIANNSVGMYLGDVRIVGACTYWDCALGKVHADASALCIILTDEKGNLYWHIAEGLTGTLADFDQKGEIVSGQCFRIRELVTKLQIPRVDVEVNGIGGFVPPILRRALKGTGCGVGEIEATGDKNKRILDAFEPPMSSQFLWAHVSVLNGPVWDQMKDWNPMVREQPDDYLDAGAGAIKRTPVRIGKVIVKTSTDGPAHDWRPSTGVHDAQFEI